MKPDVHVSVFACRKHSMEYKLSKMAERKRRILYRTVKNLCSSKCRYKIVHKRTNSPLLKVSGPNLKTSLVAPTHLPPALV